MKGNDLNELETLARLLAGAARVQRLAASDRQEEVLDVATEAATGLLDIRHSSSVLFNELLPHLATIDPASPQFDDALDRVAEEYRHIYYHIASTRLFNYVIPPG